MIFPPPLKNVVFVNGLILVNKMGTIDEISKNFWKIISMFVPGIIILDVIFRKGFFTNLELNWISLVLLLIWAIIISIPYFNMSSSFWVSIILKDKEQIPEEDAIYASAASISLIYVLIHSSLSLLLFWVYGLLNWDISLLVKIVSFIIIFGLTYYPLVILTSKYAEKFYKLAKQKGLM